jgi:hypothetical protein
MKQVPHTGETREWRHVHSAPLVQLLERSWGIQLAEDELFTRSFEVKYWYYGSNFFELRCRHKFSYTEKSILMTDHLWLIYIPVFPTKT